VLIALSLATFTASFIVVVLRVGSVISSVIFCVSCFLSTVKFLGGYFAVVSPSLISDVILADML